MEQLLTNAVTGTVLILVVLLLRRILGRHLPPGIWLALWAICIFRLLTPAEIPTSSLSVYQIPEQLLQRVEQESEYETGDASDPDGDPGDQSASAEQSSYAGVNQVFAVSNLPAMIIGAVYLCGVLWSLRKQLTAWSRIRRIVRNAADVAPDDPETGRLPSGVRLRESIADGTPMTIGVLHPVILIPPGLSGTALDYILAHECVHAKRRDNLWNCALAAVLVVHWFNPIVWLMAKYLRRDLELSCDRAVAAKLTGPQRADYARVLLAFSSGENDGSFSCAFAPKQAEERIVSVMRYRKLPLPAAMFAAALIFGICVTFAATPASADSAASAEIEEVTVLDITDPIAAEREDTAEYDEETVCVEGTEASAAGSGAAVMISRTISLAIGKSWSKTFAAVDCDSLQLIVSGFSGDKYKVIIKGSNGYSYESAEQTEDCTVVLTNAQAEAEYTVYIINVGTVRMTAGVNLSAYGS